MNRITAYIHQSLQDIYPPEEVKALSMLICCDMLGVDALDIYMGKDIILSACKQRELENIIFRLQKNEPIQYIRGYAEFCGRNFRVAPGVLIPRPETAELVDLIVKENPDARRLLDIGTGSGCIAISLALHLREMQVEGWDVSLDALTVARENARNLNAWVAFSVTDILNYDADEGISEQYDIWVSNPPYICRKEAAAMSENVIEYEPHTALFVEDHDPLLFYRVIGEAGLKQLVPGGFLYFEINALFGNECADLLNKIGYEKIEVIKDISKRDRFVIARKPLNKTL